MGAQQNLNEKSAKLKQKQTPALTEWVRSHLAHQKQLVSSEHQDLNNFFHDIGFGSTNRMNSTLAPAPLESPNAALLSH